MPSPSRSPRSRSADDEITPIISAQHGSGQDYQALPPRARSPAQSASKDTAPRRRKTGTAPTRDGNTTHAKGRPQDREDEEEDRQGWFGRLVEKYGAVELDNKGSVARDHLALERTFLAWLRTSLSFASIGIAVTQLFRLNTTIHDRNGEQPLPGQGGTTRLRQLGKPLGATFLGISILVLLVGWRRYFESQHWIIKGKFPASRGSIVLVTGVAGALIVASLVVVIAVVPTQFEKR